MVASLLMGGDRVFAPKLFGGDDDHVEQHVVGGLVSAVAEALVDFAQLSMLVPGQRGSSPMEDRTL